MIWAKAQNHPVLFEENKGQFAAEVDFIARGKGYIFALSESPIVEFQKPYELIGPRPKVTESTQEDKKYIRTSRLKLNFLNSNTELQSVGINAVARKNNYIMGRANKSVSGVKSYQRVKYSELYSNIDVEYYYRDGHPEYDFIIKPGGAVNSIGVLYEGADGMQVKGDGSLAFSVSGNDIQQPKPVAYQIVNGTKEFIAASYLIEGNILQLHVDEYDKQLDLIIDPQIVFSSYYGGDGDDHVYNVGVDADDNIYLIGSTRSVDLASVDSFLSDNPFQRITESEFIFCPSCPNADSFGEVETEKIVVAKGAIFVSKLSPDGKQVIWSTYIYPDSEEFGFSVGRKVADVSSNGEVAFSFFVFPGGEGLPLVNEVQGYKEFERLNYVAKLNSDGTTLEFATFLQLGNLFNFGFPFGMDVSPSGEVAVVGRLHRDHHLPLVSPLPGFECVLTDDNQFEGFVVLLTSQGQVKFSSCLGGGISGLDSGGREALYSVDISSDGDLYLLGFTDLSDFPVVNGLQGAPEDQRIRSLTVSIIDPVNSELKYSSYFSPSRYAVLPYYAFGGLFVLPQAIASDSNGNAVFTTITNELYYPVLNSFQPNLEAPLSSYAINARFLETYEIYLAKLNPVSNRLEFGTYLGGSSSERSVLDLRIDTDDNIYLLGGTSSNNFPTTDYFSSYIEGETANFISKFSPDGKLAYSALFGSNQNIVENKPISNAGGVALNSDQQIIIASNSENSHYPLVDPIMAEPAGGKDIGLMIIDQSSDVDTDADGVDDTRDVFPMDPDEWRDTDSDGVGNASDTDDDGDGVLDVDDHFPLNSMESRDADDDGIGDQADLFDDDSALAFDFDGDGWGDFRDGDSDGDLVENQLDAFPGDPDEHTDIDEDGIGDNADLDLDNDGFEDAIDLLPNNPHFPAYSFNRFEAFVAGGAFPFVSHLPNQFTTPVEADVSWAVAFDQHIGGRSLGTLPLSDGQTASMKYTRELISDNVFGFWYKVESEPDNDVLYFLIDGEVIFSASGGTDWTYYQIPISGGMHDYEWRYVKNDSISALRDAAWIDEVRHQVAWDLSAEVSPAQIKLSDTEPVYEHYVRFTNNSDVDLSARVRIPLEGTFAAASWECVAINGALCPSSGEGDVSRSVALPANSETIFTLRVQVPDDVEHYEIDATVHINMNGVLEEPSDNNKHARNFVVALFESGFESTP
jgi:hypothetical protein